MITAPHAVPMALLFTAMGVPMHFTFGVLTPRWKGSMRVITSGIVQNVKFKKQVVLSQASKLV